MKGIRGKLIAEGFFEENRMDPLPREIRKGSSGPKSLFAVNLQGLLEALYNNYTRLKDSVQRETDLQSEFRYLFKELKNHPGLVLDESVGGIYQCA